MDGLERKRRERERKERRRTLGDAGTEEAVGVREAQASSGS